MLEPLGVDPVEEKVYRGLVGRSHATLEQIVEDTGLAAIQVRRALSALRRRRFVECSGAEDRYAAVRPDEAYEPLLRERQHELDTARTTVERMLAEYRAVPRAGSVHDVLEIVEGQESARNRFEQLHGSTRGSNESFVKPPLLVHAVETDREPLRTDIRYRVVYDPEALGLPGMVAAVAGDIAAGEQARTAPVPLKMVLFDRARVFLPISQWRADSQPVAMIVHGSALTEAIAALFDATWSQAQPLQLTSESIGRGDPDRPDVDDLRLLSLLRAGLTDEAIARQTDSSPRTVGRRVRRLMDLTDTNTRFQLGVRALERGWLESPDPDPT